MAAMQWTILYTLGLLVNGVIWLTEGSLGHPASVSPASIGTIQDGPVFTTDLPAQITFQNTEGLILPCTAKGRPAPANEWLYSTGSSSNQGDTTVRRNVVQNIPRILTVLANNSLWFHPFKESQYRSGVHATKLRCVATNTLGSIISTEVTVKAVIRSQYTVFNTRVADVYVMRGAAAVLRCDVNPPHLTDVISVLTWQRGNVNITTGDRFLWLASRTLYVYNVSDEDIHYQYRCVTLNQVTGDVKYSDPASIYVLDPVTIKPTITDYRVSVAVDVGSTAVLPCMASGYPEPTYSYTRDGLQVDIGGRYQLDYGNLVISDVQEIDDGYYMCKAENSQGNSESSTSLRVREKLEAFISPVKQTIDAGEETFLLCNIRGFPVESVIWYKDGSPITGPTHSHRAANILIQNHTVLQLVDMHQTEQGVYQCFVGNKWETVQTSAEIWLGEARPKIVGVLVDRYVSPGENVTLNCTVTGNPQPEIQWVLDGQPLLNYSTKQLENVSVTELADGSGNTVSTVTISSISIQLGGRYMCTANNSVGRTQLSVTVCVYGEPFIKALSNATVLANSVLLLQCSVSGYPLKQILWMTGGVELPLNHRQHVWSNGTLLITEVTKSDAGEYTCVASNVQGEGMQRTLHVTVLDPPSIEMFDFGQKKVGDRVSVSCVVSRGDLPLQFVWLKDGRDIPTDLGIVIQHTGAFSSMLSIPKVSTVHSGNYTCVCNNKAASDQVSDYLHVNLPPRWISEPYDVSLVLGGSDRIPCESYGIPSPNISWTRATEDPGHYTPLYLDQENNSTLDDNITVYQTEEGSLVVTGAQRSDEGHYLCQATNDVGTALGKLISLTVHIPAYFETSVINKTVVKGRDIHLDCQARGEFPLVLTWSQRGGDPEMNRSNTRFLHSEKLYNNGKLTTLKILGTELDDTGVYVCSARNEYGADSMLINLLVQDVPSSPQAVHVTDVGQNTVTVAWSVESDGNAPILSYIVTYQPISGITGPISVEVFANTTQTTLRYLQPAVMYHLVVTAKNIVGKGNRSQQVVFTTKEAAPAGPPQNVQAFGISEQIIQLVWEPPLESSQNGNIRGYRVFYRRHNQSEAFKAATKLSSNGSYEHMNLEGLDMFTRYDIKIQAFNSQGNGPFSDIVMEYTKEGVPSESPESVQAAAMSSQDIYVVWSPPRLQALHGILQGYRIYYSKVIHGEVEPEMSTRTTELKKILRGLVKYCVYSVQVVAYTRVGEGVRSEPVFVQTKQDVPGVPSSIKAVAVNSTAVIVSWQPPVYCNGILNLYTLYISANNQSFEEEIEIDPLEQSYILDNVTVGVTYNFAISASTVVGEGMATSVESLAIEDKVPARIASFPLTVQSTHYKDVYLPCFAVGSPTPIIKWYPQHPLVGLDASTYTVMSNGSLLLKNVTKHDQGTYKCEARNKYGTDELQHEVLILEPPPKPVLFILGRLSSLLEVGWHIIADPSVKITGFSLLYSSDDTNWDVLQISPKLINYTIHDLNCGSRYFFKIKARSAVGDSVYSDTVQMQTTGGVPLLPSSQLLLQHVNSTFAVLNLSTWQTFGCPVTSFTVEVQVIGENAWESTHSNILNNTTLYQIDLQPETWYLVRVTVYSEPGLATAILKFATKSYFGSTIGPIGKSLQETSDSSHQIYYLVIGITASILLVIVALVWLGLHCWQSKLFLYRAQNVTSGFKRDGTITNMSLLPESDKEMDMSVISSSGDIKHCPTRSHYSRTPTRVLNVSALVCSNSSGPVNRHSHISYSGSEDSFQSEKDGKIVPYATFAPSKPPPPGRNPDERTPLKTDESETKSVLGQSVEYMNARKSATTDNYYLSPLTTTSAKSPTSTEDERKPLMT